jgi:thiol-disulfide isomerase/thioredoxin
MDDGSKKPRHSPWAWAGLAMVVLVVGASVALFLTRGGGGNEEATAASGAVASGTAAGGTATSGTAAGTVPAGMVKPSADASVALGQVRRESEEPMVEGGKPLVYFMGAEWCPFCASERWALVQATSRFGRWTGLKELLSRSGQDYFPSLPTYDLTHATYTSDYIGLRHTELATVSGDPLQKPGHFEEQLVDEYDARGSIPFLFASGPPGRYTVELAYSPGLLEGVTFDELRKEVADKAPTEGVEAIEGQTDAITALICKLDGRQPASVCAKGPIPALEAEIE